MRSRGFRWRGLGRFIVFFSVVALIVACGTIGRSGILPPSSIGQPYLERYGQAGAITIWIVDGEYIRDHIDEEFTNFGQHYGFSFIPANEFWLDRQGVRGEEPYFVRHLAVEHDLMARGVDYDHALEQGDAAELEERGRSPKAREGRALLESGQKDELLRKVHKELWKDGPAVRIWIVDGELVRDLFFIDFTEGGHDKVYAFVPAGEVWIDDDLVEAERPFVLLHELHERNLMKRGMSYSAAHRESSRLELSYRRHPQGLNERIALELKDEGQKAETTENPSGATRVKVRFPLSARRGFPLCGDSR